MDERARIAVSLPRDSPTRPFWQDPPDAEMADLRSSPDLPASADIVIVGSGITGAAIAWHLLEDAVGRQQSILMLEARQGSSGASGRNGGHTKAASYRSFLGHAAAHGTAAAVQIAQMELATIRAVHGLAASEGIACDSHPCDTVDVIYDEGQWQQAKKAVAAMRAAMPPGDPAAEYTLYSRAEAQAAGIACSDDGGDAAVGSAPAPISGVIRYAAGSVSAYRFVVGVLKKCVARGLQLHTHTPVLRLAQAASTEGGRWSVETARGTVVAQHVVLATNAYTAFLVPELQGLVVPLRGQIAMLRPGQALRDRGGVDTTYSFIYDQGYEYMITRPAGTACGGDVVIGGGIKFADGASGESGKFGEFGNTDDTTLNPVVSAYLRNTMSRYFGEAHWGADHADGRVRAEWTGIMGYTPDGLPLVGPWKKAGLWLCCAFQGHGMVFSWLSGRALAEMVLGRDDSALQTWFPACFRAERSLGQFAGLRHVKTS